MDNNNRDILVYVILVTVIIIIITINNYNSYNNTYNIYNEYEFKTGDIILNNNNTIWGYSITKFAGYEYDHCGIIIDGKKRLIAHSHILNDSMYDITPALLIESEINKSHYNKNSGVIIETLDNYISREDIKKFVVLPIKNEIDTTKIFNTYTHFMNKPYEQSIFELININNNLYRNKKNNSSLFCSEFIVELLQHINIIDKNIVANTISPDKLLDLDSHDKNKLVTINFNFNNNMFFSEISYRFIAFISLPITICNKFISNI
jgi:hypothetical protein